MQAVRRMIDGFRGSGAAAVTVPPMDGALRPNRLLDDADEILAVAAPDNLATDGSRVLFSSGKAVLELPPSGEAAQERARFDHAVACLAANGEGGLAVGLSDGRIAVFEGRHKGKTIDRVGESALICPTALLFTDPDTLYVCQGSAQNGPEEWKRDLMQRNAGGSVWRCDLAGGSSTCVADGLAYPFGLMARGEGRGLAICESWRHQIIELPKGQGAPVAVLTDLPGYPARLAPASDGGAWLSVFAPRSQLIEFVLREDAYRSRMIAEVDPEYWIAPTLFAGRSFLEPLQGGGVKQMGILKPWAPTRSYGLLVRLGKNLQPVASFHSRADGTRHGITSCLEIDGRVLATSKGGNAILGIDLEGSDMGSVA